METRGNYILIGLFTTLGIIGAVLFFLAFARVERSREFAYYEIFFKRCRAGRSLRCALCRPARGPGCQRGPVARA